MYQLECPRSDSYYTHTPLVVIHFWGPKHSPFPKGRLKDIQQKEVSRIYCKTIRLVTSLIPISEDPASLKSEPEDPLPLGAVGNCVQVAAPFQ